jgi:hypothetical protein
MAKEDIQKLKEMLEDTTNPAQLKPYELQLGRAFVAVNAVLEEKNRTEAEQFEKFEKMAGEYVALKSVVDRLRLIQNSPTPSLPPNCTLERAIATPGFETRSLRGPLDGADNRILELQRANDRVGLGVALYRWVKKDFGTPDAEIAKTVFPETYKQYQDLTGMFRTSYAMDTAEAAGGLEWMWTGYSARLQERILLEMKVLAQFKNVIQMPSVTYVSPNLGSLQKAYMAVEQTGGESQTALAGINLRTGATTLTAKYSAALTWHSEQLDDAAIINVEQAIINDHPIQHAYAWEEAVISGDTSTTHQDTDTTAATDLRKGIVGLRFMALNGLGGDQCLDCGTFEDDKFYRIEAGMGKYSMRPGTFWSTGIKGLFKIKRLMFAQGYIPAETLMMILKGGQAGVLDYFHGKPVVVSEYQREDLNANGVYESAATKAMIMLVCQEAFNVGNFQTLEVRVLDQVGALYLQNVVRSKMAKAFTNNLAYATIPIVGAAINVDVAS